MTAVVPNAHRPMTTCHGRSASDAPGSAGNRPRTTTSATIDIAPHARKAGQRPPSTPWASASAGATAVVPPITA